MNRIAICTLTAFLLISCGDSTEKKAYAYIDAAAEAMEHGRYNEAKLKLDSIRILFPDALSARKAAIGLSQQAELAEQRRSILFQDSLLAIYEARLEQIRRSFVFEKDTMYMDKGIYTVSSQALEKNIGRNYLRGQVDEDGRMNLISNYTGTSFIHHKSVRVAAGDLYIDSPVSEDVYEFKDLGVCYEKCNFVAGNDGGLCAFIAMHRDEPMSVTLNGSRTIKGALSASDRKAIADLYDLSVLLSTIRQCHDVRDESERRIRFVKKNMEKSGTDTSD